MPLGRRRNRIDRSLRERGVPPEPQIREREVLATTGPWDEADAPDDDRPRIDLGALRLPVVPGMELRIDVNGQALVGATVRAGDSLLVLRAHAAPRNGGVWSEVRRELAANASGPGALREVEGPFGPELAGTVVAQPAPGGPQRPERQPARFLGVDGPRWFLHAVLIGPAAGDAAAAAPLEELFRGVVVVRGNEPMPVREPLLLTLPPEAAEQIAREQGGEPGPPVGQG